MTKQISRRRFLNAATASGLVSILPRHVLGRTGGTSPNEKLNIAVIGLGWMGSSHIKTCANENLVALCDVDSKLAAPHFAAYPKAKPYQDFRVMLEKQQDIDAVVIATPDHTHAVIAAACMQMGKHVYCQKPLTHDVFESRRLAQIAKETGVVTQMGIQGHSTEAQRVIREWIWGGAIGEVHEVDAWCSLSYSPHGKAWWSSPLADRPKQGMAVPSTMDWDKWIGPAPMRPYHTCYHPAVWRCWWDFGCGMMGDRGAHTLDAVFGALKLGAPTSLLGTGIVGGNNEVHPDKAKVTYKFAAREGFPPLTLNWYEGQEPPRPEGMDEGKKLEEQGGVLFKGTKGTLMCGVYGDRPYILERSLRESYERPAKTLPRVKGSHFDDWYRAIKSGSKAGADFDYSGPLTELALLGNLAKRFPEQELLWDNASLKVSNLDDANEWVKRPYRKGWTL